MKHHDSTSFMPQTKQIAAFFRLHAASMPVGRAGRTDIFRALKQFFANITSLLSGKPIVEVF